MYLEGKRAKSFFPSFFLAHGLKIGRVGYQTMGFVGIGFAAVVGLVWLFTAPAACGQQQVDRPKEKPMPEKTIEAVLKEHTNGLMSLPDVVGTAQSLCAGKPCIKVYVVKKTPELVKQIPSTLEGYVVKIQETGEIQALPRS